MTLGICSAMTRSIRRLLLMILAASGPLQAGADPPHGMDRRPEARPYLGLPADEGGSPPSLLSRTGVFDDVPALRPSAALIPYDLIVPFWSDGAEKSRWVAVPHDRTRGPARIRIASDGAWSFPEGTVFVKHLELRTDESRPETRRRLETRLLVRDRKGGVYGLSYRWSEDQSDAELVPAGRVDVVPIRTASGGRLRNWSYPGPADCRQCHTPAAGGVLGVRAYQLNREFAYPSGVTDNQLRAWGRIGLVEPPLADADIARASRLARHDDPGRTIEERARSYLDVNCAQCH